MRQDLYSAIKSNMPPLSGCRLQRRSVAHFNAFFCYLLLCSVFVSSTEICFYYHRHGGRKRWSDHFLLTKQDLITREWMSRFLTAQNRLYSAIHVGIRWKIRTEDKSITYITKTKNNTEKANNTKRSKTKLYATLV